MDEELLSIHKVRLEELKDAERLLIALENAGVDNWEGYSDAMEEYNQED